MKSSLTNPPHPRGHAHALLCDALLHLPHGPVSLRSLPVLHHSHDPLLRLHGPWLQHAGFRPSANLESVRQALNALMEQITETQMANGMDIMTMVDRYSSSLQANRNNNAALDLAMREVDEWNKRFGRRSDNGAPPVVDQP